MLLNSFSLRIKYGLFCCWGGMKSSSVKNKASLVGCVRQALGPGALGGPGGSGWRGRWERGLGWGRHVNPRPFHFNVWQNSLQKKRNKASPISHLCWVQGSCPSQVVGMGSLPHATREPLLCSYFHQLPHKSSLLLANWTIWHQHVGEM